MGLVIKFGNVTSESLGLVCTNYNIEPAKLKTHKIAIPFRDGELDLTDTLGRKYENRKISIEFYFHGAPAVAMETLRSVLESLFDSLGITTIKFSDDTYNWKGRVALDSVEPKGINYLKVNVSCDVEPYKYNGSARSL